MKPLILALSLGGAAAAQTPDADPARQALAKSLAGIEKQLLGVADAMPDEKYAFAPTAGAFRGVRNFAKQLKHAAAYHYLVAAAILGETPPADAADERGPDNAKSKAEVTAYARDSFAYLRKALATIDERNLIAPMKNPFGKGTETRLALFTSAIVHSSNHYGQCVEYLRMNGIVPPAL